MSEHDDGPARGVWTDAPDGQMSYTMWPAFRVADRTALDAAAGWGPATTVNPVSRGGAADEVAGLLDQAAATGIVTRGCVYPYVRSYEWYLLDPARRRAMLAEHGAMAREYPVAGLS